MTPRGGATNTAAVFGRAVREARTARGWRLQDLADATGIGIGSASRIENGTNVTLGTAGRIAAALGVPLAALLRPVACLDCVDAPPRGFTCQSCGAAGAAVTG